MNKTYAYVGCRTTIQRNARGKGISVYEVDNETGHWKYLDTIAAGENPSYLLADEKNKKLYTIHGDGKSVSAFDVSSVLPVHLNTVDCQGKNPVYLTLSRDATTLKVANYATGTIATLGLDEFGLLSDKCELLSLPGEPGPHRIEQTASHPHFIKRFVNKEFDTDWYIVPDKGTDTLHAIQWLGHELPVLNSVHTRECSAPRHAAFHPYKPLMYVVNELDSTLTVWTIDVATGRLNPIHTISVIPPALHALTRGAGIAITEDASTIYISNRGHDTISVIKLNDESLPIAVDWISTTGNFPRFICLSDDQQFLYVANEKSDSIVQFSINNKERIPNMTGHIIKTGSPVCIVFATI